MWNSLFSVSDTQRVFQHGVPTTAPLFWSVFSPLSPRAANNWVPCVWGISLQILHGLSDPTR